MENETQNNEENKEIELIEEEKGEEKSKKENKKGKKNKYETEILDLKNKVSELEDKLIRSSAELVNYRKRKDEEVSRLLEYSNEDLIKEIIVILDNFESAISMDDDNLEDEVSKFLSGFKLIYNNLYNILEKFGVKAINPVDEEFNPDYHHAVMTDNNSSKDNDIVTEVLQKGYMLKNRVIRPAMVKVNQVNNEKKGDKNE